MKIFLLFFLGSSFLLGQTEAEGAKTFLEGVKLPAVLVEHPELLECPPYVFALAESMGKSFGHHSARLVSDQILEITPGLQTPFAMAELAFIRREQQLFYYRLALTPKKTLKAIPLEVVLDAGQQTLSLQLDLLPDDLANYLTRFFTSHPPWDLPSLEEQPEWKFFGDSLSEKAPLSFLKTAVLKHFYGQTLRSHSHTNMIPERPLLATVVLLWTSFLLVVLGWGIWKKNRVYYWFVPRAGEAKGRSSAWNKRLCYLSLVLGMWGAFQFSLDRENAWMLPEVFIWKQGEFKEHVNFHWTDLKLGMDTQLFEFSSRNSRPVSTYVEILDSRIRAMLWRFIPPHPNLSLVLLISLVLSPLLTYRWLRLIGLPRAPATAGALVFLFSPGNLSTSVMLFRPAKALTNAFLLGVLVMLQKRENSQHDLEYAPAKKGLFGLLLLICFGLFCDETALLVFPMLAVCYPRFTFSRLGISGLFAVLGTYVASVRVIFPALSRWADFSVENTYFKEITSPLANKKVFLETILPNYLQNTWVLFKESFGLASPFEAVTFAGQLLHTFSWLAGFSLLGLAFVGIRFVLRETKMNSKWWKANPLMLWLARLGVMLVMTSVAHTILLFLIHRTWALYWYGAYFSVFFALTFAILVYFVRGVRGWVSCALVGITLLASLHLFSNTNRVYRLYHYYPYNPPLLINVFNGTVNRFAFQIDVTGEETLTTTKKIWEEIRNTGKSEKVIVPAEQRYIPLEMGAETR